LGDHAVGALERLRAQPTAHLRGLVDHRPDAKLHQLVGGDQAGDAGADDRDLLAVPFGRDRAQAGRVRDPVVKGEREIRPEDRDRAVVAATGCVRHQSPSPWMPARPEDTRRFYSAVPVRPGCPLSARSAVADQQAWSRAWVNSCGLVTHTAWSASTSATEAAAMGRASRS